MPDFTLVQPPSSLWECDECGALVIQSSKHDLWHAQLERHTHAYRDFTPIGTRRAHTGPPAPNQTNKPCGQPTVEDWHGKAAF